MTPGGSQPPSLPSRGSASQMYSHQETGPRPPRSFVTITVRFPLNFVPNLIDLPKFVASKQLISTSSVAELRRQPREEASPAEARKEVPQQSLTQLGTKREEGKENQGGRAKSPPPRSSNPSTAKRTFFLSTPNGEPPRPIQLSQRAYDWLQQRGLVKSRPPVASPDTSSTSA